MGGLLAVACMAFACGGAELETAKWQAAIDAAAAQGGGRVTIPAGLHRTGQLDLRSNVELHLEKGAVLEGAPGLEHYRVVTLPCSEGTWSAIVMGLNVTNVAITGEGEINGRGELWPMAFDCPKNVCQEGFRARGIFFSRSKGIRLEDFTLRDAACWGIVFKCSEDIVARRVKVDSHANQNNDGFDVEARNVLIEDCDVDSGDDAYCIKSNTPDFVVEHVRVRNCVARSHCNGYKLGTASHGTMRDIRFEHCRTEAPRRDFMDRRPGKEGRLHFFRKGFDAFPNGVGIGAICVECVDGGVVEDVFCDDIEVAGFQVPIFVRGGQRLKRTCGIPPNDKYVLRNIVIQNVRGRAESWQPSSVTGVDACRARNVTLRNVAISCRAEDEAAAKRPVREPGKESVGLYPEATIFARFRLPVYGLYVDHADDVKLENVVFTVRGADPRPAISPLK